MNTFKAQSKKINFYSATEIASKIHSGELTSEGVLNAMFDQIEKHNSTYNGIITLNKESALVDAKNADESLRNGEDLGLLHGVPITIKDTYETKDIKTTSGFLPLTSYIPNNNAVVVNLVKNEGAIIIGKTNCPTLAMDMQTDNPIFGKTNNPWDTSRATGGSSGGCASALATGMTPLSFGSDMGGSIRHPSSFCGVYGLKPTNGIVSTNGHIPPVPDEINGIQKLGVLGPLARSIDDLELALSIIAKSSTYDRAIATLIPSVSDSIDIADLKIAWTDDFSSVPVSDEVKKELKIFVDKLRNAGATVDKTEPKDFPYEDIWETWGLLVGMMTGHDKSHFLRKVFNILLKPSLKNIPMARRMFEPCRLSRYFEALNKQNEYITQMDNFLSEYDAWICPVSSTTAFKHHAPSRQIEANNIYNDPLIVNKEKVHYLNANTSYTTIFNVTESPVLSMPIALDSNGLPIGIQVVGKRYDDFRLLKNAKTICQYSIKMKYPLMTD